MMNLKETINFKTLREKGPAAIDVKGDEVVQVISKGSEIKVIISQEHYLNLLAAYNQMLVRAGVKKEETVDIEERLQSFEERLSKVMKATEEEEDGRSGTMDERRLGATRRYRL